MTENTDLSPDDLPSYSESISFPSTSSGFLPHNLANARTTLISSLLTQHISPHLHTTALSGLSSSTLLVIPSNVSSLKSPSDNGSKDVSGQENAFPGETIVGFPSAENLSLIRLRGQENSLEFWRQPAVIRELEEQLRTQLRWEGHHVIGDEMENPKAGSTGAKSAGFFRKKAPSAEWKTPTVEPLGDGKVRTGVALMDVSLRIENEMGLYETRTGKAVVVKVDVGG